MSPVRKRPEKLKCKPGFVQRGSACQPIKPKKNAGLATKLVSGALGAGVVAAGVAAIASRKKITVPQLPSRPPQPVETQKQPPQKKPINKKAVLAVAGISAAGVVSAGAIAASNPRVQETMGQQVAFRQADAIRLAAKVGEFKQTPEEKAAADKIRSEIRTKYPAKTVDGNYAVDTDSDRVAKDMQALFEKNRQELATTDNPRHRKKLLQQNALIKYNQAMHELSKSTHPHLVVAGFRDQEGNLVGTTAGMPDPKYKALYFGGFMVAHGADKNAAVEFLKTNKQVSENMGYEGRLTGEPHETAKPLYQRYGGRPVPGDPSTWIFDGKKIKNEGWYKNHDSLRAVSDIVEINGYDDPKNTILRQKVDDLAKVPPHVLQALKNKGLKLIQVDNKPVTQMDDNGHLKNKHVPGTPEGTTYENAASGLFNFKSKSISIRGDVPSGGESTALHETGHAIAELLGFADDPKLKALHKKVYSELPRYQQQGKPGVRLGCHELFAESYAQITKNPKLARRMMHPDVYKYFNESVFPELDKLKESTEQKTKRDSMPNTYSANKKKAIALENGNFLITKPFFDNENQVYGSVMIEVEPDSVEYKEWRGDSVVAVVRNVTRSDKKPTGNRPTKAGYTWVERPGFKNGGFFRKIKGGGLAAKLVTGAVVAGAATAAAVANRQQISAIAAGAKQRALQALPDKGKNLSREVHGKINQVANATEAAIDKKIGGKKPTTSQRIAKEVAIEVASTLTARAGGNLAANVVGATTGNAPASLIAGLSAGRLIKKGVRSKLYDQYGEGLQSEKGKKIVRGAVQLASLGANVGMGVAAARSVARSNEKFDPTQRPGVDRDNEFQEAVNKRQEGVAREASRSRQTTNEPQAQKRETASQTQRQQSTTGEKPPRRPTPEEYYQERKRANEEELKARMEELKRKQEEAFKKKQKEWEEKFGKDEEPEYAKRERTYRQNRQQSSTGSTSGKGFGDWHDTLGVKKNASPAEIKKAYREMARKYHPDVNKSPDAKKRMQEVNAAYEKLKSKKDSMSWEAIDRAYREAWNVYPKMSIEFWTENL